MIWDKDHGSHTDAWNKDGGRSHTPYAEVKTQEGYGGRWNEVISVKRARKPKRLLKPGT
jgi:hypothetical protein